MKYNEQEDIQKNKQTALYSYLWFLVLFAFVQKKQSRFVQFHARQGLVLFLLSFLTLVPFLGQVLMIVLIVISIIGLLQVNNGAWWKIPFIYEISKKIK